MNSWAQEVNSTNGPKQLVSKHYGSTNDHYQTALLHAYCSQTAISQYYYKQAIQRVFFLGSIVIYRKA